METREKDTVKIRTATVMAREPKEMETEQASMRSTRSGGGQRHLIGWEDGMMEIGPETWAPWSKRRTPTMGSMEKKQRG